MYVRVRVCCECEIRENDKAFYVFAEVSFQIFEAKVTMCTTIEEISNFRSEDYGVPFVYNPLAGQKFFYRHYRTP